MRLALLGLVLTGGCIIYEKDVIHHRHRHGEGGGPWEDLSQPDDRPEVEEDLAWFFAPDTLSPGQTAILSLSSDPGSLYAEVAEVALYGAATVCAIDARQDELLVTVSVDAAAEPGTVDALIVDVYGSGTWVEDALTISFDEGAGGGAEGPPEEPSEGCGG